MRDRPPSTSCDLCNLKTQLDFVSIEELMTDGSMRKYMGYICDECSEKMQEEMINKLIDRNKEE